MSVRPDDFDFSMRQRFHGFEQDPPEDLWQKIRTGISEPVPVSNTAYHLRLFVSMSIYLLLCLAPVITAYIGSDRQEFAPGTLSDLQVSPPPDNKLSQGQISDNADFDAEAAIPVISHTVSIQDLPEGDDQSEDLVSYFAQMDEGLQFNSNEDFEWLTTDENNFLQKEGTVETVNNGEVLSFDLTEPVFIQQEETYIHDTAVYEMADTISLTALDVVQEPVHDYGRAAHMFAGLKFTPSMISGRGGMPDIASPGVEFDLGYEKNGLILQGGLGLEFMKYENQYEAVYRQWEATGDYNYVTWFDVDTIPIIQNDSIIGYVYRPTFHTTRVEVYDSIAHTKQYANQSRYTLLHIPLMAGYRWTRGNWGLGIKAGVSYSLLLFKKEDDSWLLPEDASLNGITRLSPLRNKHWFNLMLAPEFEYFLSDDWSIGAEPWFRYSFGSFDATNPAYKPRQWSCGINTGIKLHF